MNTGIVAAVAEVPVNPKVLAWARSIRGLSVDDAAALLDVSVGELADYESGRRRPLVGFLRLMSARYQINFTSLLMPEPLGKVQLPADHRTRSHRPPLSIDTLVALEEVAEALEAFQDIAGEVPQIVPTLGIGEADISENPEVVAARERRKFGISLDTQLGWKTMGEARRVWRQEIEGRGIFTYMIPMPPSELSGFSMLRNGLGAICVNDREPSEGAKIFTLFHEYCHLLLRQAGISDENNSDRVERFCNQFAAAFLMPKKALVETINNAIIDFEAPREFSDGEVKRLATKLRVSMSAMAMRLEEAGLAPKGFYRRRTGPWDIPAEKKPQSPDSKPSYLSIRLKRLGRLHARTVIRATRQRVINSVDAYDLTGLQPRSLEKLQLKLG